MFPSSSYKNYVYKYGGAEKLSNFRKHVGNGVVNIEQSFKAFNASLADGYDWKSLQNVRHEVDLLGKFVNRFEDKFLRMADFPADQLLSDFSFTAALLKRQLGSLQDDITGHLRHGFSAPSTQIDELRQTIISINHLVDDMRQDASLAGKVYQLNYHVQENIISGPDSTPGKVGDLSGVKAPLIRLIQAGGNTIDDFDAFNKGLWVRAAPVTAFNDQLLGNIEGHRARLEARLANPASSVGDILDGVTSFKQSIMKNSGELRKSGNLTPSAVDEINLLNERIYTSLFQLETEVKKVSLANQAQFVDPVRIQDAMDAVNSKMETYASIVRRDPIREDAPLATMDVDLQDVAAAASFPAASSDGGAIWYL